VFGLARRRYRRKLAQLEARRALEQERARIARDIHDHLGSTLTRITLLSQPPEDGDEAVSKGSDPLKQIHSTAHELTQAMGEVVWAVNPEHDTLDSLVNYLTNHAHGFLRLAGIRCRLQMPVSLPPQALTSETRHNLFLAFKEALNNVVKHADATEVQVSLVLEPHQFTLTVGDNGCGLGSVVAGAAENPSGPNLRGSGHGNGLANMKSRLSEIGGRCEWQSEPTGGTRVRFVVPLKPRPVE
jgi:signal transduction histidine kinase